MMRLRAATRSSPLARWQTEHVFGLLGAIHPGITFEPVFVSTLGDRRKDVPIEAMGGKGIFVKEVQNAVLDGRADIAVHSAKDMPAVSPDGLALGAVPRRADPRDALVGGRWSDLPPEARVATGSIRRRAQMTYHRPDLVFSGLRGNIGTRLEKASGFDAIVIAQAALDRLGIAPDIVDPLDPALVVPQVGQGALAVECRTDEADVREALAAIEVSDDRRAVDAERAFLRELGGDCELPAGAYATVDGRVVTMVAVLCEPTGSRRLIEEAEGTNPEVLGVSVARTLLDDRGGAALLGGT